MSQAVRHWGTLVGLLCACGVACAGTISTPGTEAAGGGNGPELGGNAGLAGAKGGGAGQSAGAVGGRGPEVGTPHFTPCKTLTLAQCPTYAHCGVLEARPIVGGAACLGPAKPVGCLELGCGALEIRARDPGGHDWLFPSSCVPTDWAMEPFNPLDGACAGAGGAP